MSLIKVKKLGIAISTYSEEKTPALRYKIIEDSLTSLITSTKDLANNIELYITVVVDGKIPEKHENLLKKFSSAIKLVQRDNNGGISKTKNTGIRTLLEQKVDVGILVDDDVLFHENWVETYVKYIEDFQLHHHAWNDKRIFEYLKIEKPNMGALKSFSYFNKKGYDLFKHPASCGIFLTFTPHLIEKIGYFKVMPGKYGCEHQHFTLRANRANLIGHPQDIINSYEFIEHIGVLDREADIAQQQKEILHSVSDDFLKKERINSGLKSKGIESYYPCVE